MKVIVVYKSIFGNTARVAEAIASGLRGAHDVEIIRASETALQAFTAADLIIAGAPTHAHGLPSQVSRSGAVQKEKLPSELAASGMRELLAAIPAGEGRAAAAFDTRGDALRILSGAASKGIAKRLRKAGFQLVARPESFIVSGMKGPLLEGELQRAADWGATLAKIAVSEKTPERVA